MGFSVNNNAYSNNSLITTINQNQDSVSKSEKIEKICDIYQKLIFIQEHREKDPLERKEEQKWTYFHHVDGSVVTEIETTVKFESNYTYEQQIAEEAELQKQLENLDAFQFIGTLTDETDQNSVTRIMNLLNKYNLLISNNLNDFNTNFADLIGQEGSIEVDNLMKQLNELTFQNQNN